MTNNIHTLNFDSIILDLKASNVKSVFKQLANHTSRLIGTPTELILKTLMQHEEEQSSSIGNGVAVAHMKLPHLTSPMIIYTKLNKLIDFKSIDGEPVDLICLILSPEHDGPKHLRRIAKTARYFGNEIFRNQLRAAQTTEEVRFILNEEVSSRKMAA